MVLPKQTTFHAFSEAHDSWPLDDVPWSSRQTSTTKELYERTYAADRAWYVKNLFTATFCSCIYY